LREKGKYKGINMAKELKSNLVNGRVPAGESCFYSSYCKEKEVVCNGTGCPVADGETIESEFSCALARMAELIHKKEK
jgi:hypothetical protein